MEAVVGGLAGAAFGALLAVAGRRVRSGEAHPPGWSAPLLVAGSAAAFSGCQLEFPDDPFVAWLLGPSLGVLLALGLIDLRRRLIPNAILGPAFAPAVAAIVVGAVTDRHVDLVAAAIGMAALGGLLLVAYLVRPSQMGFGDVKLAAFIGLVLGSQGLRYVAVAGVVGLLAGGVGGAVLLLSGRGRTAGFAYGPFLVVGAFVAAFLAPEIARGYLSAFS